MPKRRKQRDLISTLPDEILCHILSFLPTRTSMATSVLSRRWRCLWKKVQVLDVNDDFCYTHERSDDEAEERFLVFLAKVAMPFNRIHKFRLSCQAGYHLYEDILEWIDWAIRRVRELHFSLRCDWMIRTMPCSYMRSTSLVSLVLEGNMNVPLEDLDPGEIIFPSLKNLELRIHYVNLEVFLSGCPVLETLRATLIKFITDETYFLPEAINMPRTLKSLTLEERYSHSESQVVTLEHLQLDTPSLEYLHLKLKCCYNNILVCDYPMMNKARLCIFPKPRHLAWLPKLLQALCKTKFLSLSSVTTECLLRAPVLDLPDFCNLNQLQLDFQCFSSKIVIDLLHCCPNLQALKIYVSEPIPDWILLDRKSRKRKGRTQPISVPDCIISHLNTVEYRGYQNTAEEHEFTAYILQRGLVLKTMTIHPKYSARFMEVKIRYELSKIPRGSSFCRLEVV